MLNYKLKLLDVQYPKVKKVFKDRRFKNRGILNVGSRYFKGIIFDDF